jgi:Uma2 family endonuclease
MTAPTAIPTHQPKRAAPLLENGDRLPRDEFERRYGAMPDVKKAELIEGEVYMPSPVRANQHGEQHADLIGWLVRYRAATPGVRAADNATVRLDLDNEPQPDVALYLDHDRGGQTHIDEDGYLAGAPELVAEVAASSVSVDLGRKMTAYRRNGVREYMVWRVLDGAVDWFRLRGGQFEPLATAQDGILRSDIFPGLWLDPTALLAGDLGRVFEVLHQGIASADHAAFVARLARKPTD